MGNCADESKAVEAPAPVKKYEPNVIKINTDNTEPSQIEALINDKLKEQSKNKGGK